MAKRGGGGAGLDESLSTKTKRRVPRPFHHLAAQDGPPSPLPRGRISNIILAARFLLRPSLAKPLHESWPNKNKGGGARHGCFRLPRTSACGRARLSALRRGTRQAVTSGSASGCASR